MVNVREKTIDEIEAKVGTMTTSLNKISYLESALGVAGTSFEIKRFIWGELARLYEERKMFERAARALSSLAQLEPMWKERMDSYVMAAEMFCRLGKLDDAEQMFSMAARDVGDEGKSKVLLARKNVYFRFARELERSGKRAKAVKFYERLNKMRLNKVERDEVLEKLREMYKGLGMFREMKLLASE
jgi:tetratricopeptide (TPR) repeat protein